jgi:hypothetical protein
MLARMKTHTRRPRAEYEALYDLKLKDRLTYAELAAESGIPIGTLQYWFRRFKAEREPSDPSPSNSNAFIHIAVDDPSPAAAVEIILRDNVRLRVCEGFDERTVLRLVELLGC